MPLSTPFVDPAMFFVPVTLVDLAFLFTKGANKLQSYLGIAVPKEVSLESKTI